MASSEETLNTEKLQQEDLAITVLPVGNDSNSSAATIDIPDENLELKSRVQAKPSQLHDYELPTWRLVIVVARFYPPALGII